MNPEQYNDLAKELAERLVTALRDMIDRVPHPRHQAMMAIGAAEAMARIAVDIMCKCYREDTGKNLDRDLAISSVISACHEQAQHPIVDDLPVVLSDQVEAFVMENPGAGEAMRETLARIRQAVSDLDAGRYRSMEEAMDAIGAVRIDHDD